MIAALSSTRDIPGPGSYTPRETDKTNKYRNSYNLQLYSRERKIELHDKSKIDLPGPQMYTLPSDFGNPQLVASAAQFVIPQQTARKKRTRNNAMIQQSSTKKTNLLDMRQSTEKYLYN